MSFLKKIALYYHTIKFLKPIQLYYRLYYKLRPKPNISLPKENKSRYIFKIEPSITNDKKYEKGTFYFLNLEKEFKGIIDWNFAGHGKLWTYNLNYFEYLSQESLSKETGLRLMNDFIDKTDSIRDGLEPFPVSLRLFNWMKFIIEHSIEDQAILNSLYAQYHLLQKNIEFHLLGNHLLENLFALLSGSAFFNEKKLFDKYSTLLKKQLEEQILEDSGHFELSPMYHQIMLYRLLDTINFITGSNLNNTSINAEFKSIASKMLSWINNMTFRSGDIPLFNDSAFGIAPSTAELNNYADRLDISKIENLKLFDSGYRQFNTDYMEMKLDVGKVGPDYIPGHAHSDMMSFELQYDQKAFIVDTGISTYEIGEIRDRERSTRSHNTVSINNENQSQVWGGFRVAKRAKINIIIDDRNEIKAAHDGYKSFGNTIERTFKKSNSSITIIDRLKGNKINSAQSHIHFHPNVEGKLVRGVYKTNLGSISIKNATEISIESYLYAPEFNIRIEAKKLVISFDKELEINIY